MQKLNLLFTKEGFHFQFTKNKNVLEAGCFYNSEEKEVGFLENKLDELLTSKKCEEIQIISAVNHFALMPADFTTHKMGYKLIAYNADVDEENEELMLSINKKYGVQYYYTFPKNFYQKIKSAGPKVNFNFSGEKFLNTVLAKKNQEIHINLYPHQCEFLALKDKKLLLYNNLDLSSEVDFLYFIMFTLKKINFALPQTYFYIYGETTENETFISELKKFVTHFSIKFDNLHDQNFILK